MARTRSAGNTALVQVLVTPEQKRALQNLADLRNTTPSEILREQIRAMLAKANSQLVA